MDGNLAVHGHEENRQAFPIDHDHSSCDIEMQSSSCDSVKKPGPLEFLKTLFGLPMDQVQQYPGVISYCVYLEACFQSLLEDRYAPFWEFLGKEKPQSAKDCWGLVQDVCSIILSKTADSSIQEICGHLAPLRNHQDMFPASFPIAIFGIICWATMALQPELGCTESGDPEVSHNFLIRSRSISPNYLGVDRAKRPINFIFRHFHRAMLISRWRHPIGGLEKFDESVALEVSCLNYACLRDIAKIRLVWVEDLSSHLDFNATERTLSIFRFPTFCALSILSNQTKKGTALAVKLQNGPIGDLYGASTEGTEGVPYNFEQLHREVLMSYRVIFAQNRHSRQLAKEVLSKLRAEVKDQYDGFLDILCTTKDKQLHKYPLCLWPVTCRSFGGRLQEQSSYSSQDDFLLFGQRLGKLQQFNLHQQPSELSDLWRDRRNPLQWYTFWAVLVVGGISILLSVAQLAVGIAQLTLPG